MTFEVPVEVTDILQVKPGWLMRAAHRASNENAEFYLVLASAKCQIDKRIVGADYFQGTLDVYNFRMRVRDKFVSMRQTTENLAIHSLSEYLLNHNVTFFKPENS